MAESLPFGRFHSKTDLVRSEPYTLPSKAAQAMAIPEVRTHEEITEWPGATQSGILGYSVESGAYPWPGIVINRECMDGRVDPRIIAYRRRFLALVVKAMEDEDLPVEKYLKHGEIHGADEYVVVVRGRALDAFKLHFDSIEQAIRRRLGAGWDIRQFEWFLSTLDHVLDLRIQDPKWIIIFIHNSPETALPQE